MRKKLRRIDWEAVQKYVEGNTAAEFHEVGEAYEQLVRLKSENWERDVVITGRSKPWWKAEWRELRKRSRNSKGARREPRKVIRQVKREMWAN